MKKLYFTCLFLLLSACQVYPLYGTQVYKNVCVESIPDASGFILFQELKRFFPDTSDCKYTLKSQTPTVAYSDQGLSDSDFTTMQRITARADFSLLDTNKKAILKKTATTIGSSAVVANPYSTVVAAETVEKNLYKSLAEKIALHVSAFLRKEEK
ncbi:MAG: hypothetical protein II942_00435 [Alphaproteobacteria bacterium]|nr:hypothetical protein [Alphaproteobacteria bacterium]